MMELTHEEIADGIDEVVSVIEKHGWAAGSGWARRATEDGAPILAATQRVCIEGAIEAVTGLHHHTRQFQSCPLYRGVHDGIKATATERERGLANFTLWSWNDDVTLWKAQGLDAEQVIIDRLRDVEKYHRSLA